ncbi:hypothetical protein ACFT25_38070 [Streptomyces hydrogenans]|uniref:hypothetical protein n=1 Tax=Streptomyces hydrogenans TaxID=1873719 RepID=UPI003645AD6D
MSRKTDQAIAAAANRLARIQRRDSTALSAGDQAKYFAAATVSIGQGIRRRPSRMADGAIERIWADAQAVAEAELAAARQVKAAEIAAEAARRGEKKSKGWW